MYYNKGFHRLDASLTGILDDNGIYAGGQLQNNHDIWFKYNGMPLLDFFDIPSGFNNWNPSTDLWTVNDGIWKVVKPNISGADTGFSTSDANGHLITYSSNASITFKEKYPVSGMFFCEVSFEIGGTGTITPGTIYSLNNLDIKYGDISDLLLYRNMPITNATGYYVESADTGKKLPCDHSFIFQQFNNDRSFIRTYFGSATNSIILYDEPIQENLTITVNNLPTNMYFKVNSIIYTKPAYKNLYDPTLYTSTEANLSHYTSINRPIPYLPGPINGLLDSGGSINAISLTLNNFSNPTLPSAGMNKGMWTRGYWDVAVSSNYIASYCVDNKPLDIFFYGQCAYATGLSSFKLSYHGKELTFTSPYKITVNPTIGSGDFEYSRVLMFDDGGSLIERNYNLPLSICYNISGCEFGEPFLCNSGISYTSGNEFPIGVINVYQSLGGYHPVYEGYCGKYVNRAYCCSTSGGAHCGELCVDDTGDTGKVQFKTGANCIDMYAINGARAFEYDEWDLTSKLNGTFIFPYSGDNSIIIPISYKSICDCPSNMNEILPGGSSTVYLHINLDADFVYGESISADHKNINVYISGFNLGFNQPTYDYSYNTIHFYKQFSKTSRFEATTNRNDPLNITLSDHTVTIPAFRYYTGENYVFGGPFGVLSDWNGSRVYNFEATTITIPAEGIGFEMYNPKYMYGIYGFSDSTVRGIYVRDTNPPVSSLFTLALFEPDSFYKYGSQGTGDCWVYGASSSPYTCCPGQAQAVTLKDYVIDSFGHGFWQTSIDPSAIISEDQLSIHYSGISYYDYNNIFHVIDNSTYTLPQFMGTGIHRLYLDKNGDFNVGKINPINNSVDNTIFNTENALFLGNLQVLDGIYNISGTAHTCRPYEEPYNYRFLNPNDASRFILYSGCNPDYCIFVHESISGIPIKIYGGPSGYIHPTSEFFESQWYLYYWNLYDGMYWHVGYHSYSDVNYESVPRLPYTYRHADYDLTNNSTYGTAEIIPVATLHFVSGTIEIIDDRVQPTNSQLYGIQSGFPYWDEHYDVWTYPYHYYNNFHRWKLLNIKYENRTSGNIDFIVDYSQDECRKYYKGSILNIQSTPLLYYYYWVNGQRYIESSLPKRFTLVEQTGVYSIYYNTSGEMDVIYGRNLPPSSLPMSSFDFVRDRKFYKSYGYYSNSGRQRNYPTENSSPESSNLNTNEYQGIDNSTFTNLSLRVRENPAASIPDKKSVKPIYSRNPTCQISIIQN